MRVHVHLTGEDKPMIPNRAKGEQKSGATVVHHKARKQVAFVIGP